MTRSAFPLVVLALLVLAAAIAAGCAGTGVVPAVAGDIKKFSSADEIREYIENNTALAAADDYAYGGNWVGRDVVIPQAATAESAAKGMGVPAPSVGSADYSTTNIQVAGVDEPDFVKNDGKYIYVISGQTLAIVDAYPAASAAVVSRTEIADSPRDIFINGKPARALCHGNRGF